jgi:hypothetical protein
VQSRIQLDGGVFQADGYRVLNRKGQAVRAFQPYASQTDACETSASRVPQGTAFVAARFDALELTVFSQGVAMLAEEMGGLLERSSISPNIRERRDASCALFDADGRMDLAALKHAIAADRAAGFTPFLLVGTAGTVDIGAIEYLHKRIIQLRDEGKAVLLVSVELDEVRSLSDRILVMFAGRIMGERGPGADERELGLLMAGVARDAA